jgi:hypothetical protein
MRIRIRIEVKSRIRINVKDQRIAGDPLYFGADPDPQIRTSD